MDDILEKVAIGIFIAVLCAVGFAAVGGAIVWLVNQVQLGGGQSLVIEHSFINYLIVNALVLLCRFGAKL